MSLLLVKLKTALALGLPNLARVAAYRLQLKAGIHPVQKLTATAPTGPFFHPPAAPPLGLPPSDAWRDQALYFGWLQTPLGEAPPQWSRNPFSGAAVPDPARPWWAIPDFDPAVGDIKILWEASRFDWLLAFAERAREGDASSLARLEAWLADWLAHNPPYLGPNWKCGQETSIRVMHLAMAALILDQPRDPQAGLLDLIELHLARIAPTISYAVGQDNNHGTSEAAALFIGGAWLAAAGRGQGRAWADLGRRSLEERVLRLVEPDGGFSQYSTTYHRVLLDTLSMAEAWRIRLALPPFSAALRSRMASAVRWLHAITDPANGDAPNLGANDGARLNPLTDTPYRDFRPSLQLAAGLWLNARAVAEPGPWDWPAAWLGLSAPTRVLAPPASQVFDDSGYAVLHQGDAMVLLRYPRFRFRPSQADALHLDLWRGGRALLRDAGSFSYNDDPRWLRYFAGTESHNTVQFDNRDQMPRLSRFLFGGWLKTEGQPHIDGQTVSAAYRDGAGARHERSVTLAADHLSVEDKVEGFADKAVLRWRLPQGDWRVEGSAATNGEMVIGARTSTPLARMEIVEGQESLHYLQRTPSPVLEIEVRQAGVITTEVRWAP